MLKTFEFIGKNGIDEEDLNEYRKFKLLESYIDGYNYRHIAYKLGNAEIIYGDYREYNREIEILKNLSNEDIKRVVSTYLISDNMITMHVTINEKRWYTPIASFLFNQIFTRIQRPDLGIF
jgi:predicted Zn-dependent peptidase